LDRLHKALQTSEPSPHVLEQVEERLFALRGAARKYGVDPDRLADLCERYTADLSACDHEDEILAQLTAAVSDARQIYGKKAHALSEARHTWSRRLEEAVMEELPALKLAQARFFLQLETDRSLESAAGYDQVEFWVQTNAGSRPGPLMKVASGGELSRLLLAIKVVISQKWSVPTLIFDEIDTGMGGAAADAVGVRLERLAHHVQVIAITHAPQVAARAKDHYVVAKSPQDGCTHVLSLCPDGRREEIARMLSGARVSDEARAAASQLLEREAS